MTSLSLSPLGISLLLKRLLRLCMASTVSFFFYSLHAAARVRLGFHFSGLVLVFYDVSVSIGLLFWL